MSDHSVIDTRARKAWINRDEAPHMMRRIFIMSISPCVRIAYHPTSPLHVVGGHLSDMGCMGVTIPMYVHQMTASRIPKRVGRGEIRSQRKSVWSLINLTTRPLFMLTGKLNIRPPPLVFLQWSRTSLRQMRHLLVARASPDTHQV